MKTSITQKQLKHAIHTTKKGHGIKQERISGAYFDADKRRIVVTDGHVLLQYHCDPSPTDQTGVLIPIEAFAKNESDARKTAKIDVCKSEIKTYMYDDVRTTTPIDATFPNYERVIPTEEPKFIIGFSRSTLLDLLSALPKDYEHLRFELIDAKKAVRITAKSTKGYDAEAIDALIMPRALYDDDNE